MLSTAETVFKIYPMINTSNNKHFMRMVNTIII